MRDKSQNDLENLFERHYILREDMNTGAAVVSKLQSKPIEQVINVIVGIVDLGGEVPQGLIDRVVDDNKTGQLIATLQDRGLAVPAEIAHAIEVTGDDDIGMDGMEDEASVGSEDRFGKELEFDTPDFSTVPDEEKDDAEPPSFSIDPSRR